MRYVVHGAGGIGSVVGARLWQAGHEVVLVARGPHLDATRDRGLRIEDPEGAATLRIPVAERPELDDGDVVLLAVKSHQTDAALDQVPRRDIAVACLQNGVANEPAALRRFPDVYGVSVLLPVVFLEPGVVQVHAMGILDVGRYPNGLDERAERLAADFRAAGFDSVAKPDIMRWKHGKLLDNLGNAVEAVCGPEARRGPLVERARQEGIACLEAAGIEWATERGTPRVDAVMPKPVGGRRRLGGSTWQSLQRGAGSVEADFLNGEIVLLGRLHGVPTPVNALLQEMAVELADRGGRPGAVPQEELLARL